METYLKDIKMQIKRVPIDYVKLDTENSRKHPDKNMDAIIGSIKTFGQVEPLVVQASTKIIIGGNGRVEAMRKLGFKEIDIVEVDVNDVQAKAMALALNRSGELAEWNMEQLQTTLDMLKAEDFDLDSIGFDDSFFLKENNLDDFDNDKESSNKFIIEIQFPDEESMREEYDSLSEKGLMARIKNG